MPVSTIVFLKRGPSPASLYENCSIHPDNTIKFTACKNPNFLLLFLHNATIHLPPSRSLFRPEKGLILRYSLVPSVGIHCKTENRTDPKSGAMGFIQRSLAYPNKRLELLFFGNAISRCECKIFPQSLYCCIDHAKISAQFHV